MGLYNVVEKLDGIIILLQTRPDFGFSQRPDLS